MAPSVYAVAVEKTGGGLTLGDLLALVDFGNFLVEELVTLLTDLNNLLALQAQSYI